MFNFKFNLCRALSRTHMRFLNRTGLLSTVHKPFKIIAQKGKHQVGERDLTTTGVCCMYAAGEFIPSMLIFKCM